MNPVMEYVSFGDLKFPKTVYKYRTIKDENHLSVLTDQVVFFAAPKTFDDDFDCRIPERFDLLTDDDIFDQYYKIFKKQTGMAPLEYREYDSSIYVANE